MIKQAREWIEAIRLIDLTEHEKEGIEIVKSLIAEIQRLELFYKESCNDVQRLKRGNEGLKRSIDWEQVGYDKGRTEAVELYRTTLLDQFATAAMQALLSNPEYSISKEDAAKYGSGDAVTAHYAYKQADAMLSARKEAQHDV